VLQGEEAHQHDARQQHHLTCPRLRTLFEILLIR
jgi:hypothetical protein